jgi:hypothetical protein
LIERLGAAKQITQLGREARIKLGKFIRKLIACFFDEPRTRAVLSTARLDRRSSAT